jgi:hypothetical protein
VIVDDSLGAIANFARKIRLETTWDGKVLTVRTTPFGEHVTPTGNIQERGAITTVHIFRFVENGQMTLDTTNFRAVPPVLLHGQPYSVDDPVEAWLIRGCTEVFKR